jgi:hypothetical protein
VSRLRGTSKAPLAVAGILAVPLFFVGLMAFALKLDMPSHHLSKHGKLVLGDPTKATVGKIYLAAFSVSIAIVLAGVLAMLLRSRLAPIVPAVAGIVASALLLSQVGTWADQHTARYPLGVDNIPASSPQDLLLRGEWEQNAQTTAHQIGLATIGLAIAAIVITVLLEIRRRRGIEGPPIPTPPDVVTGRSELIAGRATEPPL